MLTKSRCANEFPDCGKRLFGLITPYAMAGTLEHDETRSGDRVRKLPLVLNGDDRVQLTRQDQCRAADPSDLRKEIDRRISSPQK